MNPFPCKQINALTGTIKLVQTYRSVWDPTDQYAFKMNKQMKTPTPRKQWSRFTSRAENKAVKVPLTFKRKENALHSARVSETVEASAGSREGDRRDIAASDWGGGGARNVNCNHRKKTLRVVKGSNKTN